MDEDLAIISTNTRTEKIKNFLAKNKKLLISSVILIVLSLVGFFAFDEYKDRKKIKISNLYNSTIIQYSENTKASTKKTLIDLVNKKDSTYSPLSLYFIIDNDLISDQSKINELFDILINETPLQNEIKNLIIYKKALFNANDASENEILDILKPLINSKSVWKSHGLYLMAEYFFSKGEKKKSKEFFSQILDLENSNQEIRTKVQKRLIRDLSE
tara:strand:+ start:175 stop:819 length:645 start_codon:yes stop_codon:yes gene_type:complete